jgi:hypothetical protein
LLLVLPPHYRDKVVGVFVRLRAPIRVQYVLIPIKMDDRIQILLLLIEVTLTSLLNGRTD